jgi:hypothetical protein
MFGLGEKPNFDDEFIIEKLNKYAIPYINLDFNESNWKNEFPDNTVNTIVGKIKINLDQYNKLIKNRRTQYFGIIKPTLKNPVFIVLDLDDSMIFVKSYIQPNRNLSFVCVSKKLSSNSQVVSSHEKTQKQIINLIKNCKLVIQAYAPTALSDSVQSEPNQLTFNEYSRLNPTLNDNT